MKKFPAIFFTLSIFLSFHFSTIIYVSGQTTIVVPSNKNGNVKINQSALPVLNISSMETPSNLQTMSSTQDISVLTTKPTEKLSGKSNFFCSTPNWQPKKKGKFDTNAVGSLNCGDFGSTPCYWTKPFIFVGFINGTPELKQVVREVIAEWTTWANISFIVDDNSNYTGDTADIKILFGDEGHNSIVGVNSWLNFVRNKGKDFPTMNLAFIKSRLRSSDGQVLPNVKGTILHEFGHALGLQHEHQNPSGGIQWNRDAVIKYLNGPPNNWDIETIENNIFRGLSKTYTQYTNYDPSSVMHYSFPAEWTLKGIAIPENDELSETDKAFIANTYPRKRASIDTSQYYRLTTWYHNRQNCLGLGSQETDTDKIYFPYFVACDNTNGGQFWKFTLITNGDYRLTNYLLGDDLSLHDYGVTYYSGMSASGNYSNQYWTITSLGSLYRLSSYLNGAAYSLTVGTEPDSRAYINRTGHWANQLWEFIPAGTVQ